MPSVANVQGGIHCAKSKINLTGWKLLLRHHQKCCCICTKRHKILEHPGLYGYT